MVANLQPQRAAEFLQTLAPQLQSEVLRRILEMEELDREALAALEDEVKRQVAQEVTLRRRNDAGWQAVQAIVSAGASASGAPQWHGLAQCDGELAKRLGVAPDDPPAAEGSAAVLDTATLAAQFNQLVEMPAQHLARVVATVDQQLLLIALAGANHDCRRALLTRLPTDVSVTLGKELDVLGPLRLDDIKKAQATLVMLARKLAGLPAGGDAPRRLMLSA